MDTDDGVQSIGHIRFTFPKKIFEVCHLMKRETEVEFFTDDVGGCFTKHIHISQQNEEHVCVSLTVDNLTFEENNLCFYVDKIKAKDEAAVVAILEQSSKGGSESTRPQPVVQDKFNTLSNQGIGQIIDTSAISDDLIELAQNTADLQESSLEALSESLLVDGEPKLKKKRGRPKASKAQADLISQLGLDYLHQEEDVGDEAATKVNENFAVTPSGRRIRKPARFREAYNEDTKAVKEVDPDAEFLSDIDYAMEDDEGDSEFHDAAEDMGDDKLRRVGKAPLSAAVSDVHVVVEKRKRGRPRKEPQQEQPDDPNKKYSAAKGKKRPNYKREANIECKICHNKYKDELSLIAHVQKLHPDDKSIPNYIAELKEQAKVECKICGKILGNKRNEMTSHMLRVHGKDDDFVSRCEECGTEFKRTFLLKEHIRRQHPKHARVLCHLCPATFKLKEYLTEHLKYTHNKQFKWQCDICHKMTSSPKNLRRHKKLHEGVSYACPICSKMFSELGNMRRHVLYVHNSQEVVKCSCPHCDSEFTSKTNLIQHINLVHLKTTAFYCDICKKYFARKKHLIEHAAMVHPGVPILSTKMDDEDLGNAEAQGEITAITHVDEGQHYESSLAGVSNPGGQSTIIIQGPDGAEHVLGIGGQTINVPDLQQQAVDAGDEIPQQTQAINILGGEGTHCMADAGLTSLAQRALEALEAGGALESTDFGVEQFLSVIGEDGQEIRVQIVRKDPSDLSSDQPLESVYVQAAATEEGIDLNKHVEGSAEAGESEAPADDASHVTSGQTAEHAAVMEIISEAGELATTADSNQLDNSAELEANENGS